RITGPDPGNVEVSQPIPSPVVYAGSDREHIDLDVVDVSTQPPPEQMDEGDKPSEADNDKATAETEAKSMVSVTIQQDMSSIPLVTTLIIDLPSRPESPIGHQQLKATTTETTTTTILPPPSQEQQSTTDAMMMTRIDILHQVSRAVDEVVTDAVDWAMQAPLRNRFRDLPEADMKEILHQPMWETDSYKTHEDHMQLYEALGKSMNRDYSEELAKDLTEAHKKKKKSRESPKMPLGSPPHQPPPPPPVGPSGALGSLGASGSPQVPPPPPPPTNQEDLQIDDDMALNDQEQLSDDADIENAHNLKASAMASNYSPPPEDSLFAQTGEFAMLMDWFCKRRGNTELKPQDLEGPAIEIIKMWIEEEYKYDIVAMYGISHWWFQRQRFYIDRHTSEGVRRAVRTQDFQLGIESYQTQLNLTKPQWDAIGFEYKQDYTVIDSPRAITFRDRINMMNPGLNTRFWTRKDVDRSKEFMFAIQKRLKTRRIFRNLESFVGG
nr:hypothetical protein [Tanacetum cinerariifolium]